MSCTASLLKRSFVSIVLVIIGLALFAGTVAAAEKENEPGPAPLLEAEDTLLYGRQPVACVMFATQQANSLAFSASAARTLGELNTASTDICTLTNEQLATAAYSESGNELLSVALLDISAAPSVRQQWWWVAWPWLMLLLAILSLIGYVLVRRHQYVNDKQNE